MKTKRRESQEEGDQTSLSGDESEEIMETKENENQTISEEKKKSKKEIGSSIYPRTCPDCLSTYVAKYSYYKHKRRNTCEKKRNILLSSTFGKEICVDMGSKVSDKNKLIKTLKNQIIKLNKQLHGNSDDILNIEALAEKEIICESDSTMFIKQDMEDQVPDQDTLETDILAMVYPRRCETCLNVYKNPDTFNNHRLKCTRNENNLCSNCDKVFLGKKRYYSHIQRCSRNKIMNNFSSLASLGEEFSEEEDHDNFAALFPSVPKTQLNPDFFQCHHCSTLYFTRTSFQCHLKNNICEKPIKRISCTYKDCAIKFTRYEHLLFHLPYYHNDTSYVSKVKYFRTFGAFEKWKAAGENEGFSYLVKCRGKKTYKQTEYIYYECQFNAVCDGKRGPKRKTERRKKAGVTPYLFCPARMSVLKDTPTGYICVNYIGQHSHELSTDHVKLHRQRPRIPKAVINHILEELKEGVSPREILDFYRTNLVDSDGSFAGESDLKINHLITLQFIKQLKYRLSKPDSRSETLQEDDVEVYEVRFLEGSDEEFDLVPISIAQNIERN